MLFNSLSFLVFFIVVFAVYYLPPIRKKVKLQNWWILLVSYFFYGYADVRMIPLLFIATLAFYGIGIWLKNKINSGNARAASWITTLGVSLGIGVLVYFKYLGFLADSMAVLLNRVGFSVSWSTLNIVMPIGVSFFTFKLVSYVIEIHREHIEPCRDLVKFGTFVAFFPTILSGPIDRPNHFLPQLDNNHQFDEKLAFDGGRQFLWGLFTKLCVADTLAGLTDNAWLDITNAGSSILFLAALIYPLQMYADFDGYSNMAIGVAKILGFRVTRNFNHPFIARNVAEYWRRWHMSLTGWLTDYVFVPLNVKFRNMSLWGTCLAAIINLVLVGFWHGANWTYGLFGLYHGLLFVPLVFSGSFGKNRKLKATNAGLPYGKDIIKMVCTYLLVAIGLVIFRAPSVTEAFEYFVCMFTSDIILTPQYVGAKVIVAITLAIGILVLEWFQRDKEYSWSINNLSTSQHFVMDMSLALIIIFLGSFGSNQFIYFQF